MSLIYRERPATGDPAGLLILHHGRGADEQDLLGLADVLDPERRLHVVTPRAPLTIPGWPGYHWYTVPRVGYPDHDTFHAAYDQLAAFHDATWERTGVPPERTVFGGFSMGSVMSYALGLVGDRPVPAGILAFSGFIPTVDGWEPDLLGLFVGRPWADEESGAVDVPAQILLFLENLWDFSEGEEAVFREEVRTTYLHELGHYLGLDEDDLADRGLD